MFRYLLSILSLLCMIVSPAVADLASVSHVNTMRDNVQVNIDKKANKANYAQNMVLQTDGSGNVVATTVGTDLLADGAIETMHLADGAVTNADLAGMIDITKLNLGTLPTSGKHMMIWNATTNEYVFERYAEARPVNLFDSTHILEASGWTVDENGVYTGDIVHVHNKFLASGYPFDKPFKANTSYTIKYHVKLLSKTPVSDVGVNPRLMVYYTDGTNENVTPIPRVVGEEANALLTTPSNKTIQKVVFNYGVSGQVEFDNIMMVEGSVAPSSYIPYEY